MRASMETVDKLSRFIDPSYWYLTTNSFNYDPKASLLYSPENPDWQATASNNDINACLWMNNRMKTKLARVAKESSKTFNSMWAINTVKNGTLKTEIRPEVGPWYYEPSFCGTARNKTKKAFMAQSKAFQEIYDSARESIDQLGESKRDKGFENTPKDVERSMADNDGVPEEEEIIPEDENEPVIESAEKTSNEKR